MTILAAEQLGRKAYGFEIKKQYVKDFYGKLATNVQRTFFQIELEMTEQLAKRNAR